MARRPSQRVALVTYRGEPSLAEDDRLIVPALHAVGLAGDAVVWSDPAVDWAAYDAALIRSCWDYHLRLPEFLAWLDGLESLGVPVFNVPRTIRWNADKRYLVELASRGVATIPTVVARAGETATVLDVVEQRGWTRFVVKPAVSASGYETHALRWPLTDAEQTTLERAVAAGDVLVQPFSEEVTAVGEYSLVFIDGAFSHSAIKRARAGEFRVQTDYGGSVDGVHVSDALVEQGRRMLALLDDVPLYARIDGIIRDDQLLLMELELIEPNLFFFLESSSAPRLAAVIVRRLRD